jgi:hypothetical protein
MATRQSSRSRNSSGDSFSFGGICAERPMNATYVNAIQSNDARAILFMDAPLGLDHSPPERSGMNSPMPATRAAPSSIPPSLSFPNATCKLFRPLLCRN